MLSLKKTPDIIAQLARENKDSYRSFNIYFQDESRFGLFTRNGRALTARGVKPICPYLHRFENLYLFGAFSPVTGDSLMLEMPYCNTDTFQAFLHEFSSLNPDEFKVLFLDNGAFHKAKRLVIPQNMTLVFLPSYSPELNPAEQIWRVIKSQMKNKVYKTMNELSDALTQIINRLLLPHQIKSITGYEFYLSSFQTIYGI